MLKKSVQDVDSILLDLKKIFLDAEIRDDEWAEFLQ